MTIKLGANGHCTGRPGILQHYGDDGQLVTALFADPNHTQPSVLACEHEALAILVIRAALGRGAQVNPDDYVYTYVDVAPELPEPAHVQDAAACIRRVLEGL